MRPLLLLLLLLALAGCARPAPLPRAGEEVVASARSADWSRESWRLRTSALFSLRGREMPLSGFLLLDGPGREARLVGMNNLGVKIFDLTVTETGEEVHFMVPELARYSRLGEAVATSVRRIFLAPVPSAADGIAASGEGIRLERRERGTDLYFLLGADDFRLREKGADGPGGEWRVRYFDAPSGGEGAPPGRIELDDFRGGYRLTLWLDEAKRNR